MTNVKVLVRSVGLMEDSTLENGKQVNNMAMELTLALKGRRNQVFGRMERR